MYQSNTPKPHGSPPVWPLPSLEGREPAIIEHETKIPGLDLAYERAHATELVATFPVDSPNGSAQHFMPSSIPAFAVADGVITYAGKQHHGYAMVIDHRNGWASYYANLEHMFARPTNRAPRTRNEKVKAGD